MHNIIASHKQIMRALWYLAKIAEQAEEGVAVFDLDGTIQFVNATWTTMHGYNTRHELVGRQISVFHTKKQMKSDVIPFIEEVKRRGQLMGPVEHMRRDGTPFLTKMKMIAVRDESGKGIRLIGFITDITERKQAQERLRQRAAELTAANEKLQEQRIEEQAAELTAADEQLQHEIAERNQREEKLQQYRNQLEEQTAELTGVNEKLQHEIAEHKQAQERLRQRAAELTAANEKLQEQRSQLEQAEEALSEDIESKVGAEPFNPQELRALSELARRLA